MADDMPHLEMDIITITRTFDKEHGHLIDINHEGVDEDVAIGILMRAVNYLAAVDEDEDQLYEDEDDG